MVIVPNSGRKIQCLGNELVMEPFIVIGNSLDMDQISLDFANTAKFLEMVLGLCLYSVYREIESPATVSLY